MKGLTHKLGPLPVWAWALIAGGTIGGVLLIKKAKATTTGEGEALVNPELAAQQLVPESGGGASGVTGESAADVEAKDSSQAELLREEIAFLTEHPQGSGGVLGSGISEVQEAEEGLRALGLIAPESTTKEDGSSTSTNAAKNAQSKFPLTSSRGKYRQVEKNGKIIHEYEHKVLGGVGKLGNEIVLKGPTTPTHAASGDHTQAPPPTPKPSAFNLTSSRGKYRETTYNGKHAHEYSTAIKGGVGPKKNLVIA